MQGIFYYIYLYFVYNVLTTCICSPGLLLGISVLKNVNILPWERRLGRVALALWLAAVLACVLFNGLHTGYLPTDTTPFTDLFRWSSLFIHLYYNGHRWRPTRVVSSNYQTCAVGSWRVNLFTCYRNVLPWKPVFLTRTQCSKYDGTYFALFSSF